MKRRLGATLKRVLASVLSFAVAFLGPGLDGWSRVWAGDKNTTRVWDPQTKQFYDVKNAEVQQTIALVQAAHLPKGERDRAVDYLRRMDAQAGSSPDLMKQLGDLRGALQTMSSNESQSLALMRFYTNSASEADRLDQMHVTQEVVASSPYYRHIRARNNGIGVITQDVEVRRIDHDFQAFVVRQPDPKDQTKLLIEQLGFTYNDHGSEKQKVAFSRSFIKMLHMVVRIFWGRSDLEDLINDPNTPADTKAKLQEQLADVRAKFPADIKDYDEEMKKQQDDVDNGKTYSPEELRQMAEKLKNMQQRVLAYYNNNQLDLLQKSLLAQFVYYFTAVSGLSYNPFDKKDGTGVDITQMKKEDIEKILQGFSSGKTVASNSSALPIPMPWLDSMADMNPHRDLGNALPPEFKDSATLKAIAAEAIQFLGFAADAQQRLFKQQLVNGGTFNPALSEQQRQAIMGEMDRWVRLAQMQIQRFQLQTMAVEVWRLKNNKLKGGAGIGGDAQLAGEAQRLLDQAEQQMIPEMEKLQEKSITTQLHENANAFVTALARARYTTREPEILTDDVKELLAQAKQMEALYLARQFNVFANDRVLRDAARDVEGNLYQEFLKPENQSPETRRALALFRSMEAAIQAILDGSAKNGDVAAVKTELAPLQDKSRELFALLGMENGPPSVEVLKKEQTALKVYQTNLSQILTNFTSNMQTFDLLNQLDMYSTKMLSSKKTDDEKWYEFRFIDRLFNIGGGRDKAGEIGVQLKSPKAFEVLFKNKGVRDEAMEALKAGDYAKVNELLSQLDPEATKKAREKLARDKSDPDSGLDILSMLTGALKNDDATIAQANINSAFKLLPEAAKGYMAGTMVFDIAAGALLMMVAGPAAMVMLKGVANVLEKIAVVLENLSKLAVLQKLGTVGRMISTVMRAISSGFRFAGKIVMNMSRNIAVTLGLPSNVGEAAVRASAARTAATIAYRSAAFQIRMAATMAAASALMSAGMYGLAEARQPGSSSYKSLGDAVSQGALGGASFGAKTGFLMLFNPLPTETLPTTGALGRLRALGESAGPIEGLSKVFGRMAAGADAEAGSMAKLGLWRTAGQSLEMMRPAAGMAGLATGAGRQLMKLAVSLGGFADGALKYFLVAEVSKEAFRDGSYAWRAAFGSNQADFGASAHVNGFTASEAWGEMAQQTSWLLLPQAPHQDPGAMDQYKEQMRAMRTLDGQGELMAIFSPEVGKTGEIKVDRPFWGMSMGEKMSFGWGKIKQFFGGEAPERPKDTLKVTSDIYLEAFRRLSDDGHKGKIELPKLLAMSVVGDEHLNASRDLETVMNDVFMSKEAKADAVKAGGVVEEKVIQNGESPESLKTLREMILMPAIRDVADKAVRQRLVKDPTLLRDVIRQTNTFPEQYKAYQEQLKQYKEHPELFPNGKPRPPEIKIENVSITNPEVVEKLGNTANWVVIEEAPGISPKVMERIGAAISMKSVKSNADRVTDRLVEALSDAADGARANGRELTIKEIRDVTSKAMTEILKSIGSGPEKQIYRDAVEHHRQSFEGSAVDRYNGESFVHDALGNKMTDPKVREARINAFAELADEALRIHGVTRIPNYKQIQTHAAKEFLQLLGENGGDAKKALKAFLLVHTGAGKTSLSMILLMPVIRGIVKEVGLDGVDFNTHGELLRAQAQADYASYFRGKTPDFRIQTLSDLAAEHLTKKSQNGLSPLQRRFQIYDEFDQLFLDPPTSLGKDQGTIEIGSPLYKAHQGLKEAIDGLRIKYNLTGEQMASELKAKDSPFATEMQSVQTQFAQNLREAIGESTPWFGGDRQTKTDAKNFRKVVEGSQRFMFSIDGYSRVMAEDFYKTAAVLDPSEIVMNNPNKGGKPLQIHGGSQVYTDLDTGGQRTYFELAQDAKITNPFENLEMTNAGDVVRSTKYMVALSGTLPEALRPILEKAEVAIRGEGTRTADGHYTIAAERLGDHGSLSLLTDAAVEHVLKGDKPLSVIVINTPGELTAVDEMLQKKGIKKGEIVRYSVGDTFKAEKLFMADQVRENQNLGALEEGTAKVVLLTVGASRGLDMKMKAYKEVYMYGLDAQKTSLVNFTQGQGRIDYDRLGQGASRKFFYFTDAATLSKDMTFREIAEPIINRARSMDEAAMIKTVAEGLREKWAKEGSPPEGLETMTDREVVDHFYATVAEGYQKFVENGIVERLVASSKIERKVVKDGKEVTIVVDGKFANEAEWNAKAEEVRPLAEDMAAKEMLHMTRTEILQRGLEDPSYLDLEHLGTARDLILAQRVRELFGAELSQLDSNPALREKMMSDPRFFDLVLRNVQRQVEHNALNSSMIFTPERVFAPETLPTMAVVGLGAGLGVVQALTLSHFLPTVAGLSLLNPAWHWLGGYTPGWLLQHQMLREPLVMLTVWMVMRGMTRGAFVKKPQAYGPGGGGGGLKDLFKRKTAPAAPPQLPGPNTDDGEDGGAATPAPDNGVPPTPPAPAATPK